MAIYRGYSDPFGPSVIIFDFNRETEALRIWIEKTKLPFWTASAVALDSRLDLAQYSIDGFSWGYEDSGAQQLALALLAHHLQDDARALRLCRLFVRLIVAWLPADWCLNSDEIGSYAAIAEALLHSTDDKVVDLDRLSKLLPRRPHA